MTETENGNGQAIQKSDNKSANNKVALQQLLTSREGEIKRLAGSIMSPERLTSLAVLAVGSSPLLSQCSLSSVVGSVLSAARMGLEIDGVHAALVPMWNNKLKGYEATCWPMFRGLVARAYDDPSVQEVTARAVYDGELFRVTYGTADGIEHSPDPDCIARGGEALIAVYAVIHVRGRAKFEVMFRSEIDAIMARSPSVRAKKFSPWESDYVAMALKTVLKRVTKTAPLRSQRLFVALSADDDNEAMTIDIEAEPPPPEEKPRAGKRAEALKEKMKAPAPAPTPKDERGDAIEDDVQDGREQKRQQHVEPKMVTDAQKTRLLNLCDKAGKGSPAERLALVGAAIGVELQAIGALTEAQASDAIDVLSGAREQRRQEAERAAAGDDDPSLGVDR